MNCAKKLACLAVVLALFVSVLPAAVDAEGAPITIDTAEYDPGTRLLSISGTSVSSVVIGQVIGGGQYSQYFVFDVENGRYSGVFDMSEYKAGDYTLLMFIDSTAEVKRTFKVVNATITPA